MSTNAPHSCRGLAPRMLIFQTSSLCNIFTKIPKFLRNRCQPSNKGLVFGPWPSYSYHVWLVSVTIILLCLVEIFCFTMLSVAWFLLNLFCRFRYVKFQLIDLISKVCLLGRTGLGLLFLGCSIGYGQSVLWVWIAIFWFAMWVLSVSDYLVRFTG